MFCFRFSYIYILNNNFFLADEARSTFKKHVNTLASIKTENNEKWLILKRKYLPESNISSESIDTKVVQPSEVLTPISTVDTECFSPQPPQYRPPPPVTSPRQEAPMPPVEIIKRHYSPRNSVDSSSENEIKETLSVMETEDEQLQSYPRWKSSNSVISNEHQSSLPNTPVDATSPLNDTSDANQYTDLESSVTSLADTDQTVSVKERKQMFNKMASDLDVLRPRLYGNRGSAHVSISYYF